jgi:glycosyltransferase involved in cell wall biosynthesis
MNKLPFISICIPAYKSVHHLERLLRSIERQKYKNYEVVVTDDSPDDSVKELISHFADMPAINYYRNKFTLGTPENWNEAIRKATGTWIKLMHDDDWFANDDALQIFYEATVIKEDCGFFFSAYTNVFENSNSRKTVNIGLPGRFLLRLNPLNLFKTQYIGNPSCTLIRRNVNQLYDSDFKWVVDFEFYIRCLKEIKKYHYIRIPLINVGLNSEQVTKVSFRNPKVEIPENHLMIEKMGYGILRNIFVYDYYWRLYRNLGIKEEAHIKKYYPFHLHPLLKQMIDFQRHVPQGILKFGLVSKTMMLFNFIVSQFKQVKVS